eukprot:1189629-Prorocentrum_minimum.AAC.2
MPSGPPFRGPLRSPLRSKGEQQQHCQFSGKCVRNTLFPRAGKVTVREYFLSQKHRQDKTRCGISLGTPPIHIWSRGRSSTPP